MTAVRTPGSPGARKRNRVIAASAGILVAALLLIGVAPMLTSASSETKVKTTSNCTQLKEAAADRLVDLGNIVRTDYSSGSVGKAKFEAAQAKAKVKYTEAQKDASECTTDVTVTTPATTAPPSGGDPDGCGVNYRPYEVAGTNRFGAQPVAVASPADLDKVTQVWLSDLKDNPFHTATQRQSRYLVDGGISTGEVQANAEYYKAHPAEWRKANADLRARLGRARLELVKVSGPYETQEAILGSNPCVAPAAKDVSSSGERWVLRIHMSQQDGGRVVDEQIICRFQIHEQTPPGQAPPARPVTPGPSGPTPTSPPRVTVPPTSPPVTSAPTTAPPVTTTRPPVVVTTTMPDKPTGGGKPSE